MFLHSPFMLFLLGILLDPTVGGMLHFSSSPEYVGLSVITNNGTDDVLFDERLADLGECAKECTAFSCLSFTYNWISGNCQGYSEISSTIESFREDDGSQYYRSNFYAAPTSTTEESEWGKWMDKNQDKTAFQK
uniref:Apple domain-containing protein n=1 Tax=Magallana gigas TaxID=29159 RepID=A0A8W8KIJ5_MAGGI|nr:uncharacterized protein LOC105332148 [Crassostrea gigas]